MPLSQVVIIGARYPGGARRKAFDADFHKAAKSSGLLEEHKKATGADRLAGVRGGRG